MTVRIAADVGSLPQSVVKTARYLFPLCDAEAVKLRVVPVAPSMLFQSDPLLVLSCHCTVGEPLAAAEKLTVPPTHADWFDGLVVMVEVPLTVNVPAVVVAVLHVFVNTARY